MIKKTNRISSIYKTPKKDYALFVRFPMILEHHILAGVFTLNSQHSNSYQNNGRYIFI